MVREKDLPIRRTVGIIIDGGTHWILQKRDDIDGILSPGKVGLWGGKMEPQDEGDYDRLAQRELEEETGLSPTDVEMVCFGSLVGLTYSTQLEPFELHSKLYLAKPKPNVALHVYEGADTYKLDKHHESANIEVEEAAPHITEALAKLDAFLQHQEAA